MESTVDAGNTAYLNLFRRAYEAGQQVDLSGIGYGRIHWGNFADQTTTPEPYYFFLAGLCKSQRVTRVLEIGTHWGGSCLAMARGMAGHPDGARDGRLVTVDITTESDNFLPQQPESARITKVVGDANDLETYERIAHELGGQPVDLLYIDADHHALPTLMNFALYALLAKPKFVVFDDVDLDEPMRTFWRLATLARAPLFSANIQEHIPEVRPVPGFASPGFGVAVMR